MPITGYYLGCPGWGVKTWVGRLFPTATRSTEFLERYARVFNTVEGNTTFYALPTTETVARWATQVPDDFRFCFKFPRAVSHDRMLIDCGDEVDRFLDRVGPLGDKLGTLFLQLPPAFGPPHLPRLVAFLDALPRGPTYAVELRHPAFFEPALELFHDGNELFGKHEYATAVTYYRKALAEWDHPAIHGNLAVALINLEQPLVIHPSVSRDGASIEARWRF